MNPPRLKARRRPILSTRFKDDAPDSKTSSLKDLQNKYNPDIKTEQIMLHKGKLEAHSKEKKSHLDLYPVLPFIIDAFFLSLTPTSVELPAHKDKFPPFVIHPALLPGNMLKRPKNQRISLVEAKEKRKKD